VKSYPELRCPRCRSTPRGARISTPFFLYPRGEAEFQLYVIRAQALRKVFASIKGYYFQAEIMGQTVTWPSWRTFPLWKHFLFCRLEFPSVGRELSENTALWRHFLFCR